MDFIKNQETNLMPRVCKCHLQRSSITLSKSYSIKKGHLNIVPHPIQAYLNFALTLSSSFPSVFTLPFPLPNVIGIIIPVRIWMAEIQITIVQVLIYKNGRFEKLTSIWWTGMFKAAVEVSLWVTQTGVVHTTAESP